MSTTTKWIDLRDNVDKARLKIATQATDDGRTRRFLFVVGLNHQSPRWQAAIDKLGFVASPNKKYLSRLVPEGERVQAKAFHPVWPNATLAEMPREDCILNLSATRRAAAPQAESSQPRTEEEKSVAVETGTVIRLGRNVEGMEVYLTPMGRFVRRDDGTRIDESDAFKPEFFLRAPDVHSRDRCADGYVRALLMGEVQHTHDLDMFLRGVLDREGPYEAAEYEQASTAIDAALVRFLNATYDTAQDAYGDANRLYDYLPPYRGAARGRGAMPLPVAVIAQRLLGDTSGKRVLVPNAWDGASFAFLARGTDIAAFRGDKDLSRYASQVRESETTWADRFEPAREQGADGLFFNADPAWDAAGNREDYAQAMAALRALNPDARAVLVLAGDDPRAPGVLAPESRRFLDLLARRYDIESVVEVGASLSRQVGTDTALRIIALRNRPAREHSVRPGNAVPVVHSWDDLKSHIDEVIVTIDLREAEAEAVDVDRVAQENDFQRPYIAFSKVGEAVTMVPKNLQGPLQYALSSLESEYGPVDQFVERELGFGQNTLGDRFSPEQVDALGLAIGRQKAGRAIIVGDETGIGKGRVLGGMATWANKQGKNVIFVTDRANLFSDLVRDLRDIEEWTRFRPLILNADGVLVDVFTNEVLQKGTPPAVMRDVLERDRTLEDLQCNLVFLTYSQIAGEDSPKADWILRRAEGALVIVDEAHVAAGSDSNTSQVICDLTTRAWGVVYSSATWAKTSENLHIYQRAMPETINMASLAATMRVGGEAFSELFSAMLARDAAFIRREHDLSKIEFVVETDNLRLDRNSEISDKVAEILSAMTYVGGELNKVITRLNTDTAATLKKARQAREAAKAVVGEVAVTTRRRQSRARVQAQIQEALEAQQGQANAVAAEPNADAAADGGDPAVGAAAAQVAEPVVEPAAPLVKGTLFRSSFGAGSVLYQVMRRLLAVLGADQVTDLALKAVEENRKPVIVFEDTGETFVRRIIKELTIPGVEGEAATVPTEVPVPTIKDLLYGVMNRLGVITARLASEEDFESEAQRREREESLAEAEVDVDEVLQARESDPSARTITIDSLPGVSPEQQQEYQEGMKRILELVNALPPIPLNAVDLIQARLAAHGLRVGEISGRSLRLEAPEVDREESIVSPRWAEMRWKVVPRAKKKSDVNSTVFQFNHGELDALVINRSAATGLSLHASPRFGDTRRRELIESQIPENPTDRIQLYGRVNRYDQIVTPKIAIPTTGIYGEIRQLMMQNKKLSRLSANIRSSRDNAAEIKHVPDLLNSVGEEVAKRYLEENGAIRSHLGISVDEVEKPAYTGTTLIQKLTSRIALLRVKEQRLVYEELYEMFDDAINRYELAGENPLKPRELDLRAKTVASDVVIGVEAGGVGSAFDGPVYIKSLEWREDLRPLPWRRVHELVVRGRAELIASGVAEPAEHFVPPAKQVERQRLLWLEDGERLDGLQSAGSMVYDDEVEQQEPQWAGVPSVAVLSSELLPPTGFMQAGPGDAGLPVIDDGEPVAQEDQPAEQGSLKEPAGISLQKLADRLAFILKAKRVTELAGTKYSSIDEALAASEENGIKRATLRLEWVQNNLPKLVPGCKLVLPRAAGSETSVASRPAVVVALRPPAKGKESQLARWKLDYIEPGFSKPGTITLASLMTGRRSSNGEWTYDAFVAGDLYKYEVSLRRRGETLYTREAERVARLFDRAPAGVRTRRGRILDGNMYLAAEWAQATKDGKGVIYTDDRGLRHRAVMLQDGWFSSADLVESMPVRLWSSRMVSNFLLKAVEIKQIATENNRHGIDLIFDTTYKGLMSTTAGDDAPKLAVFPGKGLAMRVKPADVRRMARALVSFQKRELRRQHPEFSRYSTEEQAAVMARQFKVRTEGGRKKDTMVIVECEAADLHRAVDLMVHASGIELYISRRSALGPVAAEVQQDYFRTRLEAQRAQRAHRTDQQGGEAAGPGARDGVGQERPAQAAEPGLPEGGVAAGAAPDARIETPAQEPVRGLGMRMAA